MADRAEGRAGLRRHGPHDELVVLGDEPHLPYDRPPLAKQLLHGTWTRAQLDLPVPDGLNVQWWLGQAARAGGWARPPGHWT